MGKYSTDLATCTGGLAVRWGNSKRFKQVDLSADMRKTPHIKLMYGDDGRRDMINLYVYLQTKKTEYRVNIAKSNIYEMLKYHLSIRPIRLHKLNREVMYHDKIKIVRYKDIDNYSIDELYYKYTRAVVHLQDTIRFSTGREKEAAEWQLRRLLAREATIDILRTIEYSMKMPFRSQYR